MTMRSSQRYVLSKVHRMDKGKYRVIIFSPVDRLYRDKGEDIIRTLFRNDLKEVVQSIRKELVHCNGSMRPRND